MLPNYFLSVFPLSNLECCFLKYFECSSSVQPNDLVMVLAMHVKMSCWHVAYKIANIGIILKSSALPASPLIKISGYSRSWVELRVILFCFFSVFALQMAACFSSAALLT